MTIAAKDTDAPHRINFAGRDESGTLLSTQRGYIAWGRLFLHSDWKTTSLSLPAVALPSMRVSDLALPKLAVTEALFDVPRRLVTVHHPLVTTPAGDVNLTAGGSDLSATDMRLYVPAGLVPFLTITATPQIQNQNDDIPGSVRSTLRNPGTVETTLHVASNTPAVSGYGTSIQVSGGADNSTWYTTPTLSSGASGITVAPAPKIAEGFSNAYRFSSLLISGQFSAPSQTLGTITLSLAGQSGEVRSADAAGLSFEVYPPDASLLTQQ